MTCPAAPQANQDSVKVRTFILFEFKVFAEFVLFKVPPASPTDSLLLEILLHPVNLLAITDTFGFSDEFLSFKY